MKVLVDTNIILDALTGRQPYFENADTIIKFCADKKIEGYMNSVVKAILPEELLGIMKDS